MRSQSPARTTGTSVPANVQRSSAGTSSASCHNPRSHTTLLAADLPYTEYSPAAAKRSWWSGSLFGALAFIGACGVLSVASSQHAANQASVDRLEALTQTLALIHPGGLLPAGSPSAHKFALTGVTPTDFQMSRGDCWLFATVGLLEDSYRRYGVARGWLKPEEYLHISRQAFGAAVLDACLHHNSACAFDGDAIYTGNSTTGGEVELIYYLKEIGTHARSTLALALTASRRARSAPSPGPSPDPRPNCSQAPPRCRGPCAPTSLSPTGTRRPRPVLATASATAAPQR